MNGILFAAVPSPSPTSTSSGNVWTATWLTPIISILTAVGLSGLLTTMLTGRQQRIKDLRESWLTAADSFVTAASRCRAALQELDPGQDTQGKLRRMIFGPRPKLPEEYQIRLREPTLEVARTAIVEAIER